MVRIAGGVDELAREGTDSIRIAWEDVQKWAPEVLVIMPCGCHLDKVLELVPDLAICLVGLIFRQCAREGSMRWMRVPISRGLGRG